MSLLAKRLVGRMKTGYINSITAPPEEAASGQTTHINTQIVRESRVMPYPYPYPYPYPGQPGQAPQQPREQGKGERIHEQEPVSGIDISGEISEESMGESILMPEVKVARKVREIDMKYSLIPKKPTSSQRIFAYANIRWSRKRHELTYYVIEPRIGEPEKRLIEDTKRMLEEKLDIDFFKLGDIKARDMLKSEAARILRANASLSPDMVENIMYYIERDIIGLGKLEPLMNDPNIEDISCDGINIPIYAYHRDPDIGSLKTNVVFGTEEELNTFVMKMAQKARKSISIAQPLLDASLPDGSRIQATLGTDIARRGSNFTVRRFAEEPLTPTHMLRYGTLSSTMLAYLWLAIDNGQSILISGGTATGKTSLLNALSLFIRPNLKIVSIEDTPELRLPHPHWIPEVSRTPLSIKGKTGEVSLFDLLKSSLRQRPDYIVMGEVRGEEAFVLFQQMATGHPSLATIHAASINQLIDRLTTPPISLPPSLIENINTIVFLSQTRLHGNYVRRANRILEITGIKDNKPLTNTVFKWVARGDEFKIDDRSVVLKNISERLAFSEDDLRGELSRRRRVLEWLYRQKIFDYREVSKTISSYYTNPDKVMEAISSQ